jgi:ribonuclease HI
MGREGVQGCLTQGLEEDEETVTQEWQLRGRRDERRTLYTDAAWKGGDGGVAVVQGGSGKIIVQRGLPGWAAGDSTVAELIAIEAALAHQARRRPLPKTTIIATDSKRAIRHIAEGANPQGQYVVRYIRKHIAALQEQEGGSVVLQWIPAHKGIYGNERAASKEGKRGGAAVWRGRSSPGPFATRQPHRLTPLVPLTHLTTTSRGRRSSVNATRNHRTRWRLG